jgi:hypothetical protein
MNPLANSNKDQDTRRPEPSRQEARNGIYFGESYRFLYERSKEHFRDAGDFSGGSHLVKHWMTTHPKDDQCPPFRIKVIGTYKDCLTRQVSEALKIHNSMDENEYASNHKSKRDRLPECWRASKLPR